MFQPEATALRAALHEWFDPATLAQGHVYYSQKRVSECLVQWEEEAGWVVTATVRGSRAEPYRVYLELAQGDLPSQLTVVGLCTCPRNTDCKHAAAALYLLLENPEQWFRRAGEKPAPATFAAAAIPGPRQISVPAAPPLIPASQLDANWQAWLHHAERTAPTPAPATEGAVVPAGPPPERLVFVLRRTNQRLRVDAMTQKLLKNGLYGQAKALPMYGGLAALSSRVASAEDRALAARLLLAQSDPDIGGEWLLEGEAGAALLPELLATGRFFWGPPGRHHTPLTAGPPLKATPGWHMDDHGRQQAVLDCAPGQREMLLVEPPWYLDEIANQCGPFECDLPPGMVLSWLSAPPIPPDQAGLVAQELAKRLGPARLPVPQAVAIEIVRECQMKPVLRLFSVVFKRHYWMSYRSFNEPSEKEINLAVLEFDYGGIRKSQHDQRPAIEQFIDGKLRRILRDRRAEEEMGRFLQTTGLQPLRYAMEDFDLGRHGDDLCLHPPERWMEFALTQIPRLRTAGWLIEADPTFRFNLAEPESWYTDATPAAGNDWFGVELGVMLDGEKVNLLPLLLKLLQDNPQKLSSSALAALPDNALIPLPLPDGRTLAFPVPRARQILGVLIDLMEPDSLDKKGRLKLNRLRAAELAGDVNWRWLGNEELRQMNERLRSFTSIQRVPPPADFKAQLRPYQQDGLDWLQFLREYSLAGVLADDMGLGKTIQALAHLLVEKHAGRMDRPSLIIAPTSLMTNWRQEAERFAPALRVLVLHGADRKQHFERISEHDLIITSYPLLPRDQTLLLEQEFHYVVLDEAQYIKNPKTQYAQIACALKARHHLCLTGTPMENHLGELWSLFHFLLPGFLSDEQRFNSIFRRPIEKGKSQERREILAHRVRPFVLRRKKQDVVKELPPKTEIIQNVELGGAQRDLYESVRLAMHERVRAEVEKKGLSRAHIIILDALLKLRQICCHPQLLKIPAAQAVTESAKLELLMELVPQMIEEGRHILLFSQFTSMLAIIEGALTQRQIPYVILTGETNDRATPVKRFQSGEVPIFLISLKAGGTGLNLTAADTVIHYDPWWNPAVENQATDRAHRIGQEKNVFVYKLMTVGTVEEKIGEMQARKRELVEGLLDTEKAQNLKLTPDDLDVLFAPLG